MLGGDNLYRIPYFFIPLQGRASILFCFLERIAIDTIAVSYLISAHGVKFKVPCVTHKTLISSPPPDQLAPRSTSDEFSTQNKF